MGQRVRSRVAFIASVSVCSMRSRWRLKWHSERRIEQRRRLAQQQRWQRVDGGVGGGQDRGRRRTGMCGVMARLRRLAVGQ